MTSRLSRVTASVLALILTTSSLVVGVGLSDAQADANVSLAASETKSVLAGETSTVTLTATNDAGTNLYNIAFSYTLPAGATYTAGSTTPAGIGDPQIVTITDSTSPLVTHQVLIWNNVEDLPVGDVESLSFGITANPTTFPVGSQVPGTGYVYAQNSPRTLIQFNSTTGAPVAGTYTNSDSAQPANTAVTALKVTKTEPSPETELMRGVHDHPTTYTIKVANTDVAATDGVTLTDYIPAGLEFLGCGGVDNSSSREYTGAASLVPTPVVPNCVQPASVDTVSNPSGQPAGVYTVVTWNLGDFAAGATQTIVYAAAIPLFANTLNFGGTTPSATGLKQGSNLDNNNGASTRQDGNGDAYVNEAIATGTYTGPVANGASTTVEADDSATVKSMDLSVVKTNQTPNFVSGQNAIYDLLVRTSEYTNVAGVKVTDIIPNGLCPLLPAGTVVNGTLPTDCTGNAAVTNATVDSETVNTDGSFTVIFTPTVATTANANFTIEYKALMRTTYDGSLNAPTSAGDSYVNHASITGQSTLIAALGTGATNTVTDTSQSTIVSSAPTIDKEVLPRTNITGGAAGCASQTGYVEGTTTVPNFQLGDLVCFQLTVNFSDSAQTKNAQVSDFVPVGTSYNDYAVGTASTVPADQVTQTSASPATWSIGTAQSGANFVAKGATLVMYVSAVVTQPSAATTPDITANLMKYRETNTDGTVLALRTQAGFSIAPSAAVSLKKGVTAVNGTAVTGAPAASATIKEGDTVDFSLQSTNIGTAANGNNFPVDNVVTWDLLPVPLTCASVTYLNPVAATSCTDNFKGSQSLIVWTQTGLIAPGATEPALTYRVAIPTGVSVSSVLTNNASVAHFTSPNTQGADTAFYPTGSLDTADTANWNTTAANATAKVVLPDAAVVKTGVSSITTTGTNADPNNGPNAVVAGETVDYQYQVTVPAHSSVFNAALKDVLPTGLGTPATITATGPGVGTAVTPGNAGGGFTLSTTGTLTFPTSYDNTTAAAQVFIVNLGAVPVATTELTAVNLTNTATFNSTTTLAGGTAVPARTATKTVNVVVPKPTLTKTAAGTANAGDVVTYTITAGNGAAAPIAYDTIVTDCLPAGLTFDSYGTLPSGVTTNPSTAGTGSNGCATGMTLLAWNIGAMAASSSFALPYTATVDPSAAGLATYTNTANLTTSTLNNGVNDSTVEGVLTKTASATTTVDGATTTKTAAASDVTVGDSTLYTITVVLPAQVNFYNSAVIDQLPAGLTAGAGTVTCIDANNASCTSQLPDGGAPLTPSADGKTIAFSLGDVAAGPVARTVTVTYTGTVTTAATNVKGAVLTNNAFLSWDTTNSSPAPTSATGTWDKSGSKGMASITVDEPTLNIAKSVAPSSTPAPGDTFTYTVAVTSSTAAHTSAAYNVQVKDVIPTGVVVDSSTISNAGVLSGADATTGGGTIIWTLAGPLSLTAATNLTYNAKLAPSPTLATGTALVNTATIPTYSSLPSGGRVYAPVSPAIPPTATASVTPAFPQVSLNKKATTAGPAYANTAYSWTLTATNGGTGTAAGITATDVLPANWTYIAGTANVSVAGAATTQVDPIVSTNTSTGVQTLVWPSFGPVAPTKTLVIVYSAEPTTAALTNPGVGAVLHTNSFSAVTTDATGASANSSGSYTGGPATASTTIDSADVVLTKTAGDPLVAGTTTAKAWEINVTNNGPNTAVGPFVVTDTPGTLPAGVTITAAAGATGSTPNWSCTTPTASGAFTCTYTGNLAKGASLPEIDVTAAVAAGVTAGTTVDNSAKVTDKTYDPDTDNNTDNKQLSVTSSADLAIVKKLSGTAYAGQTATWTMDVSNLGPSVSVAPITVTDTLPTGLTGVTASGTGWSCAPGTGNTEVCTRATDLAVGAAPEITLSGLIPASFTGTISNTAVVAGTTPDPISSNNTSTVTGTVNTATTISLKKSLTSGVIVPGDDATYQFDVSNTGLADARNIVVVDALPGGLKFKSFSATTGNWNCVETATGPSTVTCTLTGSIAPNSTTTVTITVTTPSDLATAVTNDATAKSSNAPDAPGSASDTPTGSSDLKITKTHPSGAVLAGNNVTYTLTPSNLGPSDSPGSIDVTDTLPAGESFVSATGTGWTCPAPSNSTPQEIDCTTAAGIAAGDSANPITVVAHVAASVNTSTLTNTATVSGPNNDPNLNNNTAHDPTDVTTSAAVTITKTDPDTSVVAGDITTYTLTIANAGPSDARNLSVTDTPPVGETIVSMSSSTWTCPSASPLGTTAPTCTLSELGVTSSTITVRALVDHAVPDGTSLENSAAANWTDSTGNNTTPPATATITVNAVADLALTKKAGTPDTEAGDDELFTFGLTNIGLSDAVAPITITDTLPTGMSYLSSVGDWTCVADADNAQKIVCTLNDDAGLAAGGTAAVLKISAHLSSDLGAGTLTNSAIAKTPTTDSNPDNNTATADVTIGVQTDLAITKTLTSTSVRIGDEATFSLAVVNNGPSDAKNVTVEDVMPPSLDAIDLSQVSSHWDCTIEPATDAGTPVDCALDAPLEAGADAPAIILGATVLAAAYPSFDNTATVATTTDDTVATNNSSTITVPVPPQVTLTVTKTHVGTLTVGQQGKYRITVANSGPTDQPGGYSIIDPLPAGLTYVSGSGTGVSCIDKGKTVTCTFANVLANGASASVLLTVVVGKAAYPTVTNTATAAVPDPGDLLDPNTITGTDVGPVHHPILGFTGMNIQPITIVLIILLILVGLALVLIARRRRRTGHDEA